MAIVIQSVGKKNVCMEAVKVLLSRGTNHSCVLRVEYPSNYPYFCKCMGREVIFDVIAAPSSEDRVFPKSSGGSLSPNL